MRNSSSCRRRGIGKRCGAGCQPAAGCQLLPTRSAACSTIAQRRSVNAVCGRGRPNGRASDCPLRKVEDQVQTAKEVQPKEAIDASALRQGVRKDRKIQAFAAQGFDPRLRYSRANWRTALPLGPHSSAWTTMRPSWGSKAKLTKRSLCLPAFCRCTRSQIAWDASQRLGGRLLPGHCRASVPSPRCTSRASSVRGSSISTHSESNFASISAMLSTSTIATIIDPTFGAD
jgi:hypothetical protein